MLEIAFSNLFFQFWYAISSGPRQDVLGSSLLMHLRPAKQASLLS